MDLVPHHTKCGLGHSETNLHFLVLWLLPKLSLADGDLGRIPKWNLAHSILQCIP